MQLADHRVLFNIADEDRKTRLSGDKNKLITLVWPLLDYAFGMHGFRMQLEWFGRFELTDEEVSPDFAEDAMSRDFDCPNVDWREDANVRDLLAEHIHPPLEVSPKKDCSPAFVMCELT